MATYVIGDIHGCFTTLEALLAQLPFERRSDHLWLVGDLVNRGPHSLETLRWAFDESQSLGERFVVVLGNHDLHLLARAVGMAREKQGDTLDAVLAADDRDSLLEWLRTRELIHTADIENRPFALVHAGVAPSWTAARALTRARELERELIRDDRLLRRRAAPDEPAATRRARDDLHFLTRVRLCNPAGERISFSGPPDGAPAGAVPWFEHPLRPAEPHGPTLVFGHWAALGLHLGAREIGLDTGCVWGGPLTAIRLEDGALFQIARR